MKIPHNADQKIGKELKKSFLPRIWQFWHRNDTVIRQLCTSLQDSFFAYKLQSLLRHFSLRSYHAGGLPCFASLRCCSLKLWEDSVDCDILFWYVRQIVMYDAWQADDSWTLLSVWSFTELVTCAVLIYIFQEKVWTLNRSSVLISQKTPA